MPQPANPTVPSASQRVPMGRIARAEEIAEAVMWLLSERAGYVTGSVLKVAGGL